ncbi:iron-siderophore ABC transporter substrate-binding protein [uncultured Paracoccus sp.]|uniref:iron-siderophore ABC transporter substrate-binding protein n=1 Tax=uncultured Paracoccus sp. TaxID=189685 RepID=UPI0025FACE07|nr:iron-siderophore ABC transporter substrate-binding protein [uncultured Paracoccus sp.]
MIRLALGLAAALTPALAAAQDYPITIPHAFGSTVITEKPQRVATVNSGNHEVPLALGVVPVGMAASNYGDDDGDGVLPWVEDKLAELGAETPVLFDEGDGIDFEAVAATEPDVILAAYSGLTQADYDTLSQIAPVVAYPDGAWTTEWRQMIRMNSAGMGMAAEGDALVARMEDQIAQAVARHPQLKGKTAMFVTHLDTTNLSIINFYSANDTRVKFFQDLGLSMPESVTQATQPGQFFGSISAERIDAFQDVDIIVTYGGPVLLAAMRLDPLFRHMPAVANDAIVILQNDPLGNAANPTPLGLPWVLEDYTALLAGAARKSE